MMRLPLPALLPLMALAACAHDQNMTVSSVHPPLVRVFETSLALAATPAGLAPGEEQRLAAYLGSIGLRRGDIVSTDAPAGPARTAIGRALGDSGMLLSADRPAGEAAPGSWRVVVSRASASVPGCPDWSQGQLPPSAGATGRNYGCATNAVLAAMLEDPRDLIRGRDAGEAVDPRTSVRAVQVWREAVPTGKASLSRVIVQEAATGGGGGSGGR